MHGAGLAGLTIGRHAGKYITADSRFDLLPVLLRKIQMSTLSQ